MSGEKGKHHIHCRLLIDTGHLIYENHRGRGEVKCVGGGGGGKQQRARE